MPDSRDGWGEPCHTSGGFTTITLDSGLRLTMATGVAEMTRVLLNSIERDGYPLKPGECGGYNCRQISGSSSWSNHAWGLAFDLNWNDNPWRSPLTTDLPAWAVDRIVAYGWRWGGTYSTPDAMHFEYLGTPTDAATDTANVVADYGDGGAPPPPPEAWPPVDLPNGVYGLFPLDPNKRTLGLTDPRQNGSDVEYLQWVMALEVGLSVHPDGWYGPHTRDRVVDVQRFNGLEQDGWCGPDTWQAIDTYATQ